MVNVSVRPFEPRDQADAAFICRAFFLSTSIPNAHHWLTARLRPAAGCFAACVCVFGLQWTAMLAAVVYGCLQAVSRWEMQQYVGTTGDLQDIHSTFCCAGNGLPAGHRLKKVVDNNPLPDADVYVFVRCDITLKKPLHEMNIDMTKINYGWIEQRGPSLAMGDHYSGFKTAGRVSGSGLHVVPRRLVSLFVEAYSRDHNSLHWLLKVKKLSLLSDVNFIEGIDRAWSSSSDIMDNPMYVIYRGEDWPSPNVKVRVAGVVAHIADHAARGADLTKPPYSLLVEALAVAQGEVKDS